MSLVTLLVIVLVIVLLMGLPQVGGTWGLHQWGYAPSGVLTVVVVILVVLLLMGRL